MGYDRARVVDEYRLSGSSIRYVDTMSLHMATSGLSTQQLPSWRKARSDAAKALADAQEKERARVTQLRAHGDNGSAVTITNVATDGGAFGKGGPGDANSNPYKKNINQAWMGPKINLLFSHRNIMLENTGGVLRPPSVFSRGGSLLDTFHLC